VREEFVSLGRGGSSKWTLGVGGVGTRGVCVHTTTTMYLASSILIRQCL